MSYLFKSLSQRSLLLHLYGADRINANFRELLSGSMIRHCCKKRSIGVNGVVATLSLSMALKQPNTSLFYIHNTGTNSLMKLTQLTIHNEVQTLIGSAVWMMTVNHTGAIPHSATNR